MDRIPVDVYSYSNCASMWHNFTFHVNRSMLQDLVLSIPAYYIILHIFLFVTNS